MYFNSLLLDNNFRYFMYSCTKDKKNKLIVAVKFLKGKKVRIYSLFIAGYKWFKRYYYSNRSEYYMKVNRKLLH